jgi:hypothetical protein
MRSYEFIIETGVSERNGIDQLVRNHIKQDLPKLIAKSAPGLGTILALVAVGFDIYNNDYTNLALDSLAVVAPSPVQWAILATQLVNEYYGYCYINDDGSPADLAKDTYTDPKGTAARTLHLKDMLIKDLQNAFEEGKEKISGIQGQKNTRKVLTGMDTPGNPDPRKHPERYPYTQ